MDRTATGEQSKAKQSKASGKRRTTYLPSVEYRAALYPLQLELSAPKTERRTKSEDDAVPGLQLNFKTYADLCLFVFGARNEEAQRGGCKEARQICYQDVSNAPSRLVCAPSALAVVFRVLLFWELCACGGLGVWSVWACGFTRELLVEQNSNRAHLVCSLRLCQI